MKMVVVNAPKALAGILKKIFRICPVSAKIYAQPGKAFPAFFQILSNVGSIIHLFLLPFL